MNADNASVWLIAILVVWGVLGAALCDLLNDADWEPASRPRETLADGRNGTSPGNGANRQPPALPWRRCIRWPKARRRMSRANRLHRRY
jgi:hypothetical protein